MRFAIGLLFLMSAPVWGHGALPMGQSVLHLDDDGAIRVAQTTFGWLFTSEAGRPTWIPEEAVDGDVRYSLVIDDRLVVGTDVGHFVSVDNACSFDEVASEVPPFTSVVDTDDGWLGVSATSEGSQLWRSVDGAQWSTASPTAPLFFADTVAAADGVVAAAGRAVDGRSMLMRFDEAAGTWRDVTPAVDEWLRWTLLGIDSVGRLAVSVSDDDGVHLAFVDDGSGQVHIQATFDGLTLTSFADWQGATYVVVDSAQLWVGVDGDWLPTSGPSGCLQVVDDRLISCGRISDGFAFAQWASRSTWSGHHPFVDVEPASCDDDDANALLTSLWPDVVAAGVGSVDGDENANENDAIDGSVVDGVAPSVGCSATSPASVTSWAALLFFLRSASSVRRAKRSRRR